MKKLYISDEYGKEISNLFAQISSIEKMTTYVLKTYAEQRAEIQLKIEERVNKILQENNLDREKSYIHGIDKDGVHYIEQKRRQKSQKQINQD